MLGMKVVTKYEVEYGKEFFRHEISVLLELLRHFNVEVSHYCEFHEIDTKAVKKLNKESLEQNTKTFKKVFDQEGVPETEKEKFKLEFIDFIEYLKKI